MPDFPLQMNPDETILRSEEKAIRVKNSPLGFGYNVVYGTLWLTNQRIVFQSFLLGNITAYPLSHITSAEVPAVEITERITRYSFNTFSSALRLGFDNGGKEYFIPADLRGWAAAILEARITSPTLPYTQTPPVNSSVEQGSRGCWVIAGIFAAIVLCFMCSVTASIGLPLFLSVLP
jgi:hypothetical protein